MYVVKTLNPLACLCTNLFFFVFLNVSSIFLHGRYNIYDISIPKQNGMSTFIRFPSHFPIPAKFPNTLYKTIIASASENQNIHLLILCFSSFIFPFLPFLIVTILYLIQPGNGHFQIFHYVFYYL